MNVGVDNIARNIKNIYIGDGLARNIKNVYVGDANNIARSCWSSHSNLYGSVALVYYSNLYFSRDYFATTTTYTHANSNMICICYSEDRYYIGGYDGNIYSFKDGVFTKLYKANTTNFILGIVAYKKNIVAHYSNMAVVSLDGGNTWSEHTVGGAAIGNIPIRGMMHDGKQFMCIMSGDGYLYTSPNGISWTKSTLMGTGYRYIFYLNGIYIATGAGLVSYKYSTDLVVWKSSNYSLGESWIAADSDYTQNSIPKLDYINGVYTCTQYAAYNKPTGYSLDGVMWTTKAQSYPMGGVHWFNINCGDRLLAICSPNTSSGYGVWQTTDGINYTKITTNTSLVATNYCNMAYANN